MSDTRSAERCVVLACDFFLRYSAMLAGGLSRAGADVAFVSREHDLEFGGRPGAAHEFVAAAVGADVTRRTLAGRVRSPHGWAQALGVRREVRRFAPDVVHLQESICNDVRLPLAARARRGRFALTIHDPVRHPGDNSSRWIVKANRALVRAAGLVFVHGEAIRDELVELLAPKAPIVVVPHGIDPAAITPLPERPAVLFFGRLSYYKGLDVLLEAMDEVWRELPAATLTIAGEGEVEDHPALSDERVDFRLGHVPDADVAGLIEAATCVALPYRQASQSGVGSLAKAHGRPLVATSLGGLSELLADGSGLLVPPEDPSRLAQALLEVLRDRDLARRLGAAGAHTATRESSWDAVATRTLAAYDEHLLSGRCT
jgi:glycosyltransferase involved in cell wall biosynthesis